MNNLTYDARVYKTQVYQGRRTTTYYVRWRTDHRDWREPFRNSAQADSFRSALLSAARSGEAFDMETGKPASWGRDSSNVSWYDFACAYVDMKWKDASATYRHDIAYALTSATPAMYESTRGMPDEALLRKALFRWAFNTKQRKSPPDDVAEALNWVARN